MPKRECNLDRIQRSGNEKRKINAIETYVASQLDYDQSFYSTCRSSGGLRLYEAPD